MGHKFRVNHPGVEGRELLFLDDLPLSGVLEWELTQGTVLQVKLIVGPDGIPPPDDEDEYDMVLMPVWVPVPT